MFFTIVSIVYFFGRPRHRLISSLIVRPIVTALAAGAAVAAVDVDGKASEMGLTTVEVAVLVANRAATKVLARTLGLVYGAAFDKAAKAQGSGPSLVSSSLRLAVASSWAQ